jgi:hypothetical protein
MSTYRTFLALAILIAASPALADPAADKAADKAEGDTLPEDVANRFVEFFDKLTVIVVDNEKDCTRMAAGVNAHVDENEALLKLVTEAKSQHKSLPQAARDKIAKKSVEALARSSTRSCVSIPCPGRRPRSPRRRRRRPTGSSARSARTRPASRRSHLFENLSSRR